MDAEDAHVPALSDKLLLPSAWWSEGQKCQYRGQSVYLPLLVFSGCNCTEQTWSQIDIWCQSEAWHLSLSYGCGEAWLHSGFFTGKETANHTKAISDSASGGKQLAARGVTMLLLFLSLCTSARCNTAPIARGHRWPRPWNPFGSHPIRKWFYTSESLHQYPLDTSLEPPLLLSYMFPGCPLIYDLWPAHQQSLRGSCFWCMPRISLLSNSGPIFRGLQLSLLSITPQ